MKTRFAFAIVAAAALLTGCSTGGMLGGFNLISEQKEQSLGEELGAELSKELVLVEDPEVLEYVRGIGQKLTSVSMSSDKPYQFYVAEDPEVNAFAIPGWRLYIHTGLIAAAKDEAELAAVMAHEIGHAEKRHGTQQLTRQMGAQLILGVALGEEQTNAKKIAGLITNTGILSYGRSAEHEADDVAVHLLYRSGYDPNALPQFFETLLTINPTKPSRVTSLFSTHPETQDRIRATQETIASLAPKTYTRGDAAAFKAIQDKLKK